MTDTKWAFTQYEKARPRLPKSVARGACERVANLGEIAADFDVFLFDAYGVLNVGTTPIAGAPARVAALQAMEKHVMVLTNGAAFPAADALAKYGRYGYDFTFETVISSRDITAQHLATLDIKRWAAMAPEGGSNAGLGVEIDLMEDAPETYTNAQGFLLIGSQSWNDVRQAMLEEALRANPRPVIVGNPDLIAPYETGATLQPGYYAHLLADRIGIEPQFFGKPFGGIFTEAKRRFGEIAPDRVLMIGDTLHTDILGGAAAGYKTALITDHGMFKGSDVLGYIEKSGIAPDYIIPSI